MTKIKLRQSYAKRRLEEPVVLNQKLLKEQINRMSNLSAIVNDDFGDALIGVTQVMELFEWLPKGEYNIKVKII